MLDWPAAFWVAWFTNVPYTPVSTGENESPRFWVKAINEEAAELSKPTPGAIITLNW